MVQDRVVNVQDSITTSLDSIEDLSSEVKYDNSTKLKKILFNSEKIEEFKKDKAFDYLTEVEEDSWWTRFKRWLSMHYQQFIDWLFGEYKSNILIAIFLQVLPYLLIGAIIGLIFWLFIRLNPGESILGKNQKPEIYYNEEEKIVRSQNIKELIAEAVQNKDYRLAVRYYYLLLLKDLNEKGQINYEFQKTNTEYLKEIKAENFQLSLRKVMRIYDFIWYGNFAVSESDFSLAQKHFIEIETSLAKLPYEK